MSSNLHITEADYRAHQAKHGRKGGSVAEGPQRASLAKAQKKLIRQQTKDPRNKTEQAFECEVLYFRKLRGALVDYYEHQSQRLKLANGDFFSPDYPAIEINPAGGVRTVFFEVKGEQRKGRIKARDDAITKLKCAAAKYTHYRFVLAWRDPQTGEWQEQPVLP